MRPSQTIRALLLAVVATTCLATTAFGAAFIKFDGVDGESSDAAHRGWSDALAVSQDLSFAQQQFRGGGGGGGAGKVSFSDLSFAKQLDKSSPKLMEACCSGKHFPSVKLEFVEGQGGAPTTYYKVTLSDCFITSYSTSSGGDRPSESLSLNFTKIEWEYSYQDESGQRQTVKGGWDLALNKKV